MKEEGNVDVGLEEEAKSRLKMLKCLCCATKQRETETDRGGKVEREGGRKLIRGGTR